MNVSKLSSGNWRARVYIGKRNGKSEYQTFLGETRREAEMKAMQFQIEFDRNPSKALAQYGKETMKKQKDTKPASYEDMTVGECIDAYIDNLVGVSSATTHPAVSKGSREVFSVDYGYSLEESHAANDPNSRINRSQALCGKISSLRAWFAFGCIEHL